MIKVVLVEDEEYLRKELALTTPWRELGCTLMGEAVNGDEGLELILKIRPELVITDIRMPGTDGLEMLDIADRLLSDEKPAAILLTGHSDFEYARKGIKLGVRDYLLKPVDDEEFYSLIKRTAAEIEQKLTLEKTSEGLALYEQSRIARFREYGPLNGGDQKDEYVRRAVEYICSNFSRDIAISDAARELGITPAYLSRLFKSRTGYTFLEYLTCYRLRKALKLLRDPSLRINEVAYKTGFRDHGYFSQLFRRYMGVSPGRYRNGSGREADLEPEG